MRSQQQPHPPPPQRPPLLQRLQPRRPLPATAASASAPMLARKPRSGAASRPLKAVEAPQVPSACGAPTAGHAHGAERCAVLCAVPVWKKSLTLVSMGYASQHGTQHHYRKEGFSAGTGFSSAGMPEVGSAIVLLSTWAGLASTVSAMEEGKKEAPVIVCRELMAMAATIDRDIAACVKPKMHCTCLPECVTLRPCASF
eukprot:364809-Chlamydomonas_euryale.AAC.23